MNQPEFDRFAARYDRDLAKSLAVTGEDRTFYAQARIRCTAGCVQKQQAEVRRILDFGCGDGWNAPLLSESFHAEVVGVDVSSASIEVARGANYGDRISFFSIAEWMPGGDIDLAFTNGVFHHIPPEERLHCLKSIRQSLRPNGLFAFWENNPWNPGTNYVMSQCVFDENAIKISPREARRLLSAAGFRLLQFDSLFYFPKQLSFLRPAERLLRKVPLGGQYQLLCQK